MTTAAQLASFYDELRQRGVPDDIVTELMIIAAKALTQQFGISVKDAADV